MRRPQAGAVVAGIVLALAGPFASALGTVSSTHRRNAPLRLSASGPGEARLVLSTATAGDARLPAAALPAALRQSGPVDCGPAALATVLAWRGRPVGSAAVARAAHLRADGVTLAELVRLASAFELPGAWYDVPDTALAALPTPFVAHLRRSAGHFVAVRWVGRGFVLVADPAQGLVLERVRRFVHAWSGRALLFDAVAAATRGGAS